jgi:hypothetical protein
MTLPTLTNDLDYRSWKQAVWDHAYSICQHLSSSGLFMLIATDAEWASAAENRDENDEVIARPTFPKPEPIPLVASNAALAQHKFASEQFLSFTSQSATFKQDVIISLSTENQTFIKDRFTGTRNVTLLQIVTRMSQLYNTPSSLTITNLQDKLKTPMSSNQTFLQYHTEFQTTVDHLAQALQPISNFDQMKYFIDATTTFPAIAKAVDKYITDYPLIADRDINALITFIILQAPAFITSGSQGYSNAAIPPPLTRSDVAAMIKAAHIKGVQEGKAITNNNNKTTTDHNSRNTTRNTNTTNAQSPNPTRHGTKHCYFHGYNFSHIGTECKVMANDHNFTPQHKAATNSTTGGNATVQTA